MICECACAAATRLGVNIDDVKNVHPYWRIQRHPLWKDVLTTPGLPDYPESMYVKQDVMEPPGKSHTFTAMECMNASLYDKLGCQRGVSYQV